MVENCIEIPYKSPSGPTIFYKVIFFNQLTNLNVDYEYFTFFSCKIWDYKSPFYNVFSI